MTENFTQSQGLVRSLASQGWFANPAGIEGHEVIVLEKRGDGGLRFYASLKPGQTLSLSERVFNRFDALAVDTRYARSFSVAGQFSTRERGRKVGLKVNVRYRVTEAKVVAMDALDPLGELRDKVIATLNREMARYPEDQITPHLIEKLVRGIGPLPHLGLIVEDAEIMGLDLDARITKTALDAENMEYNLKLEEAKRRAGIKAKEEIHQSELRLKQDSHAGINLSDINVLMQEHPELIPQVMATLATREQEVFKVQSALIAPVIEAYIRQQHEKEADINPDEVVSLIKRALASGPRVEIGAPPAPKQIVWGDEPKKALPSEKPPIKFEDEGQDKDKRIKFGDGSA